MSQGALVSSTSTGLLRHPGSVMCIMPLSPSSAECPPNPMPSLVLSIQSLPVSGWVPTPIREKISPPLHAGMLSGIPLARALVTTSGAIRAVHRVNVGDGGCAFMMQPSGAITFNGRKLPSFAGVSGVVIDLKTRAHTPSVVPIGTFMGPLHLSSDPVQSMVISSPAMVTVACRRIFWSRTTPSSST